MMNGNRIMVCNAGSEGTGFTIKISYPQGK
jgi:hypothetical protein